ncbi:hypothetical protein TorRG33x02_045920 [Trema orientale]|uniref:Uncharacterized protein n=1 Tax=Trema orientale TaxID=63057 RepID=A0A2P5FNQ7_TREOI|nr:hypothetical protein TorRG33x02_045920 [Trema orientale]
MASMEHQAGSAHKGIHHLARILHLPHRAATCPDMNSQRGRAKLGRKLDLRTCPSGLRNKWVYGSGGNFGRMDGWRLVNDSTIFWSFLLGGKSREGHVREGGFWIRWGWRRDRGTRFVKVLTLGLSGGVALKAEL